MMTETRFFSSLLKTTTMKMLLLSFLLFPQVICASPLELTALNLDAVADGKAVFVMLYDSSCEECEDVSETWNKLASEWEGHEVGIIAQSDCADENAAPVCQYFSVDHTPSFYWGGSFSWEPYMGSYTDYDALSQFAKDHISKPICSAFRPEGCDETELAKLESVQNLSPEEFDALVEAGQADLKELSDKFETSKQPLLEQQNKAIEEYQAAIDQILKNHHYQYIEQILKKRKIEELKQEAAAAGAE